ncbi:MAG TPA: hypothetical protein VFL94_04730 [Actinomycetales bacterium]|nr:hypothetical protein [Actinomycetales bacterium]
MLDAGRVPSPSLVLPGGGSAAPAALLQVTLGVRGQGVSTIVAPSVPPWLALNRGSATSVSPRPSTYSFTGRPDSLPGVPGMPLRHST